jgi:hypothetical protein
MLSLFGFGKRRRKTSRKTSKKSAHKKPPARLLKICKKYRVKATRKVGGKRVYKPVKVLAKACLKKAMAAAKKKKSSRSTTRRRCRRSSMFGQDPMMKKSCFGMNDSMMMRRTAYGSDMLPFVKQSPSFGKRRGTGSKVSRAHAMKAFRAFYKRHCAGMRRSRFGGGGNPPLGMSMGYEFCPSGMGGVLGAGSTGLFPSPCTTMNMGQAQAEANMTLPAYSSSDLGAAASSSVLASYANMFGRRRRKTRAASGFGATRKKRSSAVGSKKRSSAVGSKKRSSAVGATRKKRASAVGARRKTRRRVRRSD